MRLRSTVSDVGAPEGDGKKGVSSRFTLIELFAGIGGIRLGFESIGGQCVFTSEWNRFSQKTYRQNFPDATPIAGDITKIDSGEIPDHDLLVAGFPCQPFSIAGISKKNALGRPHGFACATQGTLFFDVARILAEKRPVAFLLENVKNLISHDRGNTFAVICRVLRDELQYDLHWKVIDARVFVPQHRERVILVGFAKKCAFSWDALELPTEEPLLSSILHPADGSEQPDGRFVLGPSGVVHEKYTLSDRLWSYLQNYARKHRAKGNGFGFGLCGREDVARTLSARYYKDGSEILIDQGIGRNPRRLTPRECARLMGFPESFCLEGVSDSQLYKQFGNSVVVPVIGVVAKLMEPHLLQLVQESEKAT
jgi:DNA (cytosine-5)-methyltransferase 1